MSPSQNSKERLNEMVLNWDYHLYEFVDKWLIAPKTGQNGTESNGCKIQKIVLKFENCCKNNLETQ